MTAPQKSIQLQVTFKNIEATDAIRNYADEKLKHCLEKFVRQETDAHVVLLVEKARHIAEVTFRTDGASFNAREESADMYSSIDALVDNLGKQLRKHKEKLTSHH